MFLWLNNEKHFCGNYTRINAFVPLGKISEHIVTWEHVYVIHKTDLYSSYLNTWALIRMYKHVHFIYVTLHTKVRCVLKWNIYVHYDTVGRKKHVYCCSTFLGDFITVSKLICFLKMTFKFRTKTTGHFLEMGRKFGILRSSTKTPLSWYRSTHANIFRSFWKQYRKDFSW